MSTLSKTLHGIKYALWLLWQVIAAAWVVIKDANTPRTQIDPVIVAYPLRVTTERAIGLFSTSITMTPGTLSLGILEVGDALPADVSIVPGPHEPVRSDDSPQGRLLLVHAVFGGHPAEIMDDLADMEQHMAPHVLEMTRPIIRDSHDTRSEGASGGDPVPADESYVNQLHYAVKDEDEN